MRLIAGALAGLVVGSTMTYWGMKFSGAIDRATLDHYTQQSIRDLEAERNATRRLAMDLARHDDDDLAVEAFLDDAEMYSFETRGYLVAGEIALKIEDGQLIRICSANGSVERDTACQDMDSEPTDAEAVQ
jgi:hypothetical protein